MNSHRLSEARNSPLHYPNGGQIAVFRAMQGDWMSLGKLFVEIIYALSYPFDYQHLHIIQKNEALL